jgi:hypothetical protein
VPGRMEIPMRLIALLAALLLGCSGAFAQTSVQQALPKLDVATFIQGQANGATSCNTVSQTAVQDTITITPPAGQYVYITEIYFQVQMDATGITQTGTISATNLTGNPFWTFASTLTTTSGVSPPTVETFPTGLKSTVAGTPVTLVPSATQSAHNYLCAHASGFFGP